MPRKFLPERIKERHHLENLDLDGVIILMNMGINYCIVASYCVQYNVYYCSINIILA
jgi:hypothetical protein